MSSFGVIGGNALGVASVDLRDEDIGVMPVLLGSLGRMRLPTESIGTATVEFTGVNAGSEIRVYFPDMTEAAGIESCAADQVLSWSAFAPGNASNVVRVVIIHPNYRIKEFSYTTLLGSQTLPVQQEPDKWYSNP